MRLSDIHGEQTSDLLTIVCEARDEPPTFASAGAERCTSKNVVINGAEICAVLVNMGRALVFQFCVGAMVEEKECYFKNKQC